MYDFFKPFSIEFLALIDCCDIDNHLGVIFVVVDKFSDIAVSKTEKSSTRT